MNSVARAVPGNSGAFRHHFGGIPPYAGIQPPGSGRPLHLLYTFDTTDSLVPVQLSTARYLPLFYCFPYNAGACGYRVMSDSQIEILYMETPKMLANFPYPDYPQHFPEIPVSLVPVSYEEHKILAFHIATGEYGPNRESLSEADRQFLTDTGYPFTQLGGIQKMWQDIPSVRCPNKKCANHRYHSSLKVFAVVWNQPVPGVDLWDDPISDDDEGVQIIFQICPVCESIHACNRCT